MYLFTLSFSQANSNEYTCIFTLVTHGVSSAAFPPDRAFHPAAPLLFLCRSHSSFERTFLASNFIHLCGAQKARRISKFPPPPPRFLETIARELQRSKLRRCAHWILEGGSIVYQSKGKIWKIVDVIWCWFERLLDFIDQVFPLFAFFGIWICSGRYAVDGIEK